MKKRPTGITILSILALISGVFIVVQNIRAALITSGRNLDVMLEISIYFIGLLALSSGIGMLLGKRWGWGIGAFYYVYAILRYANVMIIVFIKHLPLYGLSTEIKEHILLYSIRIIIHFLILVYFFRKSILEYFNLEHYSKRKSIPILFGIGVSIMLIGSLATYIL